MSEDTISRKAAIEALQEHRNLFCDNTPETFSKLSYAEKSRVDELDMAIATLINLPSAQADSKELSGTHKALDTVSRQAAIEALFALYEYQRSFDPTEAADLVRQGIFLAEKKIEKLPSAQSEERTEERTETHACDLISRQAVRLIESDSDAYPQEWNDDYEKGFTDALNKVLALPSAQPEPKWILVTEQMPERNLVVLVTTRWGEVTEGVKLSGNAWFIGRGEENAFDSDILAWMPKPEPYKGVKNG